MPLQRGPPESLERGSPVRAAAQGPQWGQSARPSLPPARGYWGTGAARPGESWLLLRNCALGQVTCPSVPQFPPLSQREGHDTPPGPPSGPTLPPGQQVRAQGQCGPLQMPPGRAGLWEGLHAHEARPALCLLTYLGRAPEGPGLEEPRRPRLGPGLGPHSPETAPVFPDYDRPGQSGDAGQVVSSRGLPGRARGVRCTARLSHGKALSRGGCGGSEQGGDRGRAPRLRPSLPPALPATRRFPPEAHLPCLPCWQVGRGLVLPWAPSGRSAGGSSGVRERQGGSELSGPQSQRLPLRASPLPMPSARILCWKVSGQLRSCCVSRPRSPCH